MEQGKEEEEKEGEGKIKKTTGMEHTHTTREEHTTTLCGVAQAN